MAVSIRFNNIRKYYGNLPVSHIDELFIDKGEIVCFLGPSGCGKTTVLRMIAGLVRQDEGDIYFGDKIVNDLPPEQRHAAMVFQNYALFPHMTVFQNVAFGLFTRKKPTNEIEKKVREVLELVQLPQMAGRYPKQLSGGEQQRIAVARALATEPEILLFDEPLSNLDAKLRLYMRFELRRLLETLEITTIYVTHDQTEAMVISDRVVILNKGWIAQDGSPQGVYSMPKSRFVADFIGTASFIEGEIKDYDLETGEVTLNAANGLAIRGIGKALQPESRGVACLRPERLTLHPQGSTVPKDVNSLEGEVVLVADFGESIEYNLKVGQWILRAKAISRNILFSAGQTVIVTIEPKHCVIIAE
jgi:iron(III) transport system ATP-binding protein